MKKYPNKLVYDYIYGNDIEEYTLEELEASPEFMTEVITSTKDKNFYDYAEENVKRNYEFIKAVVTTFKEDDNFICNIADTYITNSNNELNKIELLIIMINLIKNKESLHYAKYKLTLRTIFSRKRVEAELIKQKNKDINKEIGMGFLLIYDTFQESKLVTDYYAQETIKDIFNEIDLEETIHNNFQEKQQLDDIKIKSYLLNLISQYDQALTSYISTYPHLLEEQLKQIDYIKNNWQKYNTQKERKLYNNIEEEIHNYINYQSNGELLLDEEEILYLLGEDLKIMPLINKHNNLDQEQYEELIEDIKTIKQSELTFVEKRHYDNIRNQVINILKGAKPKDPYEIETSKEETSQIIDFSKAQKTK